MPIPFIKRERIFKKEVYEMVEYACRMNRLMQVRTYVYKERLTFFVYPYKIIPDPLCTQEYLACFTRTAEEASSQKRDASFSMARLEKPVVLKQQAFLSKDDIAKIEEDLEKLEFDLRLLREDLNIAGSGIIGGAPEEWDDEANRINTLAPTAIISWLQFDRQGRLIERMKKILNADIWLGLDPQMVLGSRKEPFLKKVLSKWYHHLFQRQLLEYHANEKGQTEESENAGEEITEEYDTESE